ncbi:hypothetical protein FPZ12_008070 [Amycolatopsis acidicola]|uniref:Uncharacterized protein n=1 Tax=Amycolatopsis acidicola TaxID=2596893 RepID=A0A5N0VC56_9PSEU|nr:hypothetical protein [Amycolatopsis acidicola]KAA9163977.1 hypothetical protein FPZ12_008070 [Amycolatopsis acidicola]
MNDLSELDRALYTAPFVLIGRDNRRVTTAHTHTEASLLLDQTDAVSIVGTLRANAIGVDIDPADTGAEPRFGRAASDDLVTWLDAHGLPWCRRRSGRPGHYHVIGLIPPQLASEFRSLVSITAQHHGVSATARKTLRLLDAPHRHGLRGRVLDGTLTPQDLPASDPVQARRFRYPRRRQNRAAPTPHQASRSEREFGDALACARAGWTADETWSMVNLRGTKAREIGPYSWRRWFWAPATTIVAAEDHLTEDEAWKRFQDASPPQAEFLGRDRWRNERWDVALAEADRERPRRRRIHHPPHPTAPRTNGKPHAVHEMLLTHARTLITQNPRLPNNIRPTTLLAALEALADAIATNDGSISVRAWAEQACLDPKSVRRARDAAVQLGLIRRQHAYRQGRHDCDAWTITEELVTGTLSSDHRSPTSYTPAQGSADRARLERQHRRDRIRWNARKKSQHHTSSSGLLISEANDLVGHRRMPRPRNTCQPRYFPHFVDHDLLALRLRSDLLDRDRPPTSAVIVQSHTHLRSCRNTLPPPRQHAMPATGRDRERPDTRPDVGPHRQEHIADLHHLAIQRGLIVARWRGSNVRGPEYPGKTSNVHSLPTPMHAPNPPGQCEHD